MENIPRTLKVLNLPKLKEDANPYEIPRKTRPATRPRSVTPPTPETPTKKNVYFEFDPTIQLPEFISNLPAPKNIPKVVNPSTIPLSKALVDGKFYNIKSILFSKDLRCRSIVAHGTINFLGKLYVEQNFFMEGTAIFRKSLYVGGCFTVTGDCLASEKVEINGFVSIMGNRFCGSDWVSNQGEAIRFDSYVLGSRTNFGITLVGEDNLVGSDDLYSDGVSRKVSGWDDVLGHNMTIRQYCHNPKETLV